MNQSKEAEKRARAEAHRLAKLAAERARKEAWLAAQQSPHPKEQS